MCILHEITKRKAMSIICIIRYRQCLLSKRKGPSNSSIIRNVAIKIFLRFSMQTNSNQEIGRYITLTPGPAQLGRLSDVTHSLYCIGPEFELRQRQKSN